MTVKDFRETEWYKALAADRQSLKELGHQIVELAGHMNAVNYRFLMLIAEFDRRKGWSGDGATASCAHWLNWRCGIDMGAAREKVRTALTLTNLPKIAAAMERGHLSYAKVRALTRVACPKTEDTLLQYALHARRRTWRESCATFDAARRRRSWVDRRSSRWIGSSPGFMMRMARS